MWARASVCEHKERNISKCVSVWNSSHNLFTLSISIYFHLCISCFPAQNKTFMSLCFTIMHFAIFLSLSPPCSGLPSCISFLSWHQETPILPLPPRGMGIAASVIILLDWKCWGQRDKPQSAVRLAVTVATAHGKRKWSPNLNRSWMERAGRGEIEKEEEMDLLKYGVRENILLTWHCVVPTDLRQQQKKKLQEQQESTTVFCPFIYFE